MKYGLKNEVTYLIKKAAGILRSDFLINENDDMADSVEQFLKVFEIRKHALFSDSEYQLLKNRQVKSRKPVDVQQMREHIITELKKSQETER